MPMTALIGAGIGAAGSIGSALIGSNASQKASAQQVAMQQQALQQQMALYGTGLSTAHGALDPFISGAQGAAGTLSNLLTPGMSSSTLAQMPGFVFASQYGTKAATNALASRGQGASAGPLATAISQYNNGLAQNTWGNTVNALQGYVGMGANAAGTLGTAALNGGIAAGNSQAATLTGIGQSQAAGTLGSANALSAGLTGASGAGSNALLYNQLFNNSGGGGLYNVGGMPATGPGSPSNSQSNAFAISQGINPY